MNLGRRRITNVELCTEVTALGFEGVTAFLASGNVIFETDPGDTGELEDRIEAGLERLLGWEVPTFVRTGDEVRAIAERRPFERELAGTSGKIQVAMLARRPTAATRRRVLKLATGDDFLEIQDRELYWLPRGNFSDSQLELRRIEKELGVMTIRTKRTFERIVHKFL